MYGNSCYYNPVTLAQYALCLYGQYLSGQDTKQQFLKIAEKLISLQDNRGAFSYNFSWRYYLNKDNYKPGWASGMAQGQAMSVLARAYKLTGNKKYLKSGEKALNFLIKPISKGGLTSNLGNVDASLKNNIMFEEFVSSPPTHTLNGFMFTLLGLYDWANINEKVQSKKVAQKYFNDGVNSLTKILKYYDIGGFSAYDLGYLTRSGLKPHIGVNYHGVHIYLLNALYSITREDTLYSYYKLWRSYVEADNENRISGVDRYETNVKISKQLFKKNADTVVVASGENYEDALSCSPLAAKNKTILLLVPSNANVQKVTTDFAHNNFKNTKLVAIGGNKVLLYYKISLININKYFTNIGK